MQQRIIFNIISFENERIGKKILMDTFISEISF